METKEFIELFETHSVEEIRAAIEAGVDVNHLVDGKLPISWLIEMYTRSSRFSDCLDLLLKAGATLDNPLLEAILLDDRGRLREILRESSERLHNTFDLACAYTSLRGVSALHLCAEYCSLGCAEELLIAGLGVDIRAETDSQGLGGQTALFHTVNSNRNYCRPMMELLVNAGADLDVRINGLVWGQNYDWETTIFDVTPVSYAQCGLFPQFHRREGDIYSNINFLLANKSQINPSARNVPNKYVSGDFKLKEARLGQNPESNS